MITTEKQLIEKQRELIETLWNFVHVGKQEGTYYGYLDKIHKLKPEISALEKQLEEEEKYIESYNLTKDEEIKGLVTKLIIDNINTISGNVADKAKRIMEILSGKDELNKEEKKPLTSKEVPDEFSDKEKETFLIDLIKKYYNQGDDYYANFTKKGKWVAGYSNDYPLQHGSGNSITLPDRMVTILMQEYRNAGVDWDKIEEEKRKEQSEYLTDAEERAFHAGYKFLKQNLTK